MKRKNIIIAITVMLTLTEFIILYYFRANTIILSLLDEHNRIIDILSLIMPTGLLYILNYYVLSPVIYICLRTVWRLLGHYEYLKKYFDTVITPCVNWLIDINMHWGPLDTSSECQNANSCEGLLALKKSGFCEQKPEIYKCAFRELLDNLTDRGLSSKSLGYPTVVCTSMILYLAACERDSSMEIITDFDRFEQLSKHLWKTRGDRGWGVYAMKTSKEYCCVANTLWALRALRKYQIGETNEYKQYVKMIYEYAHQSKFGFVTGDQPRLITTSMAISLYYEQDDETKKKLSENFDVRKAIEYVFNTFVVHGVQIEVETLLGIDLKVSGAKKAPWNHISTGYAIEALNLAYLNKDLGIISMDLCIQRIKKICKTNVTKANSEHSYYIPDKMEYNNNGIYTFPTAYLIWGLSGFKY